MNKYLIVLILLTALVSLPVQAASSREAKLQGILAKIELMLGQIKQMLAQPELTSAPVRTINQTITLGYYKIDDDLAIDVASNQKLSLPIKFTGIATNLGEGTWGSVSVFDSYNVELAKKDVSVACKALTKTCPFSMTIAVAPKTESGFLVFRRATTSSSTPNGRTYSVPVKF